MKMQIQDGGHCMLYALAMVMDVPASSLLHRFKYKGDGKRSWHIQELMDVLQSEDKSLVTVEVDPYCIDPVELTQERVYSEGNQRLVHYMNKAPGIIILRKEDNSYHAVAWDGTRVFDPHGKISEGIPNNVYIFLRLVNL